jgi:hypothetical protein
LDVVVEEVVPGVVAIGGENIDIEALKFELCPA